MRFISGQYQKGLAHMPYADINGTRLYYQVKGQGVPILFLHPPLMTGLTFAYQQHQLADQFQVITFDIRGHGKSLIPGSPLHTRL